MVSDLFLLVFGLVETSEDLPASPSSCSLEDCRRGETTYAMGWLKWGPN
jgi:hypothetical protein